MIDHSDNSDDESFTFDLYHPKPLLLVISSPSGVGKDTVVRAIQKRDKKIHFVVTATSRAPRKGEIEGYDYIFLSKEEFEQKIKNHEFFEYSLVYDQYKGVPKEQIRHAIDSGNDIIMRVDVQGAEKIHDICPAAVLIFLLPDNQKEWHKRLSERKSETPEEMQKRITTAHSELEHLSNFDYVVVNAHNQLEHTVDTILSIIEAEHHRVDHREIIL